MNRVGLQEYFEKILEFRFSAFDKIIEARFTAMEKAVQLAAKTESDIHRERAAELSRRLEALNNEAGRIAADKVTYLPRETHNADLKEVSSRIEAISGRYMPRETHTSDLKEMGTRIEAVSTRITSLERVSTIAVFLAVGLPIAIQLVIAVSNYFKIGGGAPR
jgi:hypothetical protein